MGKSRSSRTEPKNELRALRKRRELSQEAAAAKVGIPRTLWSAWEQKRRPMRVGDLNSIQKAFEATDDEINAIRTWWGDLRKRRETDTDAEGTGATA